MTALQFLPPVPERIHHPLFDGKGIELSVLRLDVIHPLISGNKWFKLKEYLAKAKAAGSSTIVSFGGAYSNHLHAVAAACKSFGLASAGVVRGERPPSLSHTLQD